MVEMLIGALASVLQQYVLNKIVNKNLRFLVSFGIIFGIVLLYNFGMMFFTRLDPNFIAQFGIAFATSQTVYNVAFKENK